MPFTDLPLEHIHMVLSQKCISIDDIQPFLRCKRTSTAAYHRLFSDRAIHITCLEKHAFMDDHYDFGVYGKTLGSDDDALRCRLLHCVKPAKARLAILKRSSQITLNITFDECSTPALVENLATLASHLQCSKPKDLHLHVSIAYKNNALLLAAVNALICLTSLPTCTTHLKVSLHARHLAHFAAIVPRLTLESLNIKIERMDCDLKEAVVLDVSKLSKLKLIANHAIPNLSFTGCENADLCNLELQLPILLNSKWIQDCQLRHLSSLKDLRIFTVNDCPSLHFLLPISYTLPNLLNLYLSFTELVGDIDCFDFDSLAPSLTFLFIQDQRSTKTANKVCTYTV